MNSTVFKNCSMAPQNYNILAILRSKIHVDRYECVYTKEEHKNTLTVLVFIYIKMKSLKIIGLRLFRHL